MKQEFLKTIKVCRNRLNLAGFLKKLIFALSIGMGVGIVFEAAAFLTPFYYADFCVALALALAVLSAAVVACVRKNTMEQAALVIDKFGFQERVITAYENLDREGPLVELQREDAMKQLSENKGRIKISLLPSKKEMIGLSAFCLILLGLMLTPSAMKERAKQLHEVQEIAKEKEQEIEEVADSLEQLLAEELTLEEQAVLREMIESLQSSMAEYQQAVSEEMLNAAEEKLDYKYENMSNRLSDLAQSMENGEASAAGAEAMQAMADKLKEMGGEQLAQNTNPNSQNGQNNENGQNGQGSQGSGNGQNGQGSQGSENGQNGQGSQSSGNGQNGQDSQGNGDGQGGQDSQGSGDGQGGQGGQGNQGGGNGQNGQGNGQGSGDGRGTGSSDALHDYVSVPNAIADSENLTGNSVDHDNSDYFRAQNGLAWEGTHISHEAVIGSYERHAYEGIATGRYPSGMEDVIKEYFASFN